MPDYVYSCGDHRQTESHGMHDNPPVVCRECGETMHRVPQPVGVIWGQAPPSKGGLHPLVKQLNDNRGRRHDEFARKKEEHVNRTEGESETAA